MEKPGRRLCVLSSHLSGPPLSVHTGNTRRTAKVAGEVQRKVGEGIMKRWQQLQAKGGLPYYLARAGRREGSPFVQGRRKNWPKIKERERESDSKAS